MLIERIVRSETATTDFTILIRDTDKYHALSDCAVDALIIDVNRWTVFDTPPERLTDADDFAWR